MAEATVIPGPVTIELTLSEREANYLRNLLQNPIVVGADGEESSKNNKCREKVWRALDVK